MPSPFPGMDPYLELPEFWHDFHASMIPALRGQLNQTLPNGFSAYVEERIYILPESQVIPDVVVTKRVKPATVHFARSAVLERTADESETVTFYPEQVKELFIEVRRAGSRHGEVVAAIELLSPSNKQYGGHGRAEYQSKQSHLLDSDTHFLEIDLLRAGAHTVAAPHDAIIANGSWDYLVCLHRTGSRNTFEIWRNHLAHRLPKVKVPLTAEHGDVILDLQIALNSTYDAGPSQDIDYRQEPDPPLSEADRKWADSLLREKGYRA